MFCKQCGEQMKEGERFCAFCGWQLTPKEQQGTVSTPVNPSPATNANYGAANKTMSGSNAASNFALEFDKCVNHISTSGAVGFVDSDEIPLYSLSNGTLGHLVTGRGWAKNDAILTNKRLYYSYTTGIVNKYSADEIVDLSDITGSKIVNYNPLLPLIFSIIAFVAALILGEDFLLIGIGVAVVSLILYLIRRTSVLSIEYAGGYIEFSVKNYGLKNIRIFQKCIYVAKAIADSASENSTSENIK